MTIALDTALIFVARGWNPVPIKPREKAPIGEQWQTRVIDRNSAPQHFNGAALNVGVMLGATSKGLTDIDLDSTEAIAVAPYLLPRTESIFGRASKRNSHFLYYTTLAQNIAQAAIQFKDPDRQRPDALLLELRIGADGHGAQTVFPPSTHPSGEGISWEVDDDPAAIDGEVLRRRAALVAACALLARYWPSTGSGHHDAALVVGGFLARTGMKPPAVRVAVEAIAKAGGSDRWRELSRTAQDAAKAHAEGRHAYGFPALRETFGKDVATRIAEWLHHAPDTGEANPGKPGPPSAPPQPSPNALELQNMTFEPIKYVVPGVIVEGLTLLAGKPKLGKSWLLLHAAIAVARGGFTLGEIHCPEGDVLYCALEDNLRRLKSRMTKLLGVAQDWPRRLQFKCEMPRLAEGGLVVIKDWIASVPHPRLIIVDTLAMVRSPGKRKDQTQYDADYAAVLELRTLANEHGIAVAVVHHLRKADADDPFDTINATLGLSGAPDTILVLKYDSSGSGAIVLHGKGRDLIEIEKVLTFNRDACTWTIAGELPDVRSSGTRQEILAALHEIDAPASAGTIASHTRIKIRNVRKVLQRLIADGAIRRLQRGQYELIAKPQSA